MVVTVRGPALLWARGPAGLGSPSRKISAVGSVKIEPLLLSLRCNEARRETLRSGPKSPVKRALPRWVSRALLVNPVVAKGVGLLSIEADIVMNDGLFFELA